MRRRSQKANSATCPLSLFVLSTGTNRRATPISRKCSQSDRSHRRSNHHGRNSDSNITPVETKNSCGLSVVVLENTAEAFVTADRRPSRRRLSFQGRIPRHQLHPTLLRLIPDDCDCHPSGPFSRWHARCEPFHPNALARSRGLKVQVCFVGID